MRRNLVLFLGLVVLVAAMLTVWRYLSGETQGQRLVLSEVTGTVNLTDGAGRPMSAEQGVELRRQDRVVTGEGSRAVLSLDAGTRVRLGPTSSVQVRSVDEEGVHLELEDGALQATVRPDGGALRVGGPDFEVLADNADFGVGVEGGVGVVETERGDVTLIGVDQPRLAEGQRAVLVDRQARIEPVSEDLLLEVAWPGSQPTREASATVTGVTAPGATVTVVGAGGKVTVTSDAKGNFEVVVPLAEGDNPVQVMALDVLGKETEVQGLLQTRDTRAPTFKARPGFP